jgi:hypothetical protein
MVHRTIESRIVKKSTASFVLIMLLFVSQTGFSQTKDYKFQSLFLFSFAKSIEWPPIDEQEFSIGVYDNQKVFTELKTNLNNRTVGAKPIVIKHFQTVDEIIPTQILFVPVSNKNNIKQVVQKVGQLPCLIVTEKEGWIKEGSIINFVISDEGKMKFQLNETAASQRKLKIPQGIKTLAISNN